MAPQVRHAFKSVDGTCAVGAALEATGNLNLLEAIPCGQRLRHSEFIMLFPISSEIISCPLGDCNPNEIVQMIFHLNDWHHWTREQIADWLEPIEVEHEVKSSTELKEQELEVAKIEA